jgi:hypothetical protein
MYTLRASWIGAQKKKKDVRNSRELARISFLAISCI